MGYKITERAKADGDTAKFRDGSSDGERLLAIRGLVPIEVEGNDLSKAELQEVYRNLPSVEKDGREVEFYHSAFKKIYKDGGLFGQIVPVLDEVLEQSVLAYSEEDNRGGLLRPDGTVHKYHPNVTTVDNYVGKVEIGVNEYYVRTTVENGIGQSGTHSFFVSGVEVYEKTADGLSVPNFPSGESDHQRLNTSESRTIPITSRETTDFSGIVDAKLQQFFERASSELLPHDMRARAMELSEKLNTPIRLVDSADEAIDNPSARHRRAKGWATANGEIVIVVPNNESVADIENTVVHEVVGHDGLEAMIEPERMDEFVTEVYGHAGASVRKKIDARAEKEQAADIDRMTRAKGGGVFAKAAAKKRSGHYHREATKEYMADMAGEIGDRGFERMSEEELTLWGKIKAKVQQFLDKFLRGLKIAKSIRLTDKDLAYILYKAWKHKRGGGMFAEAEDMAMRRKTGWDKKEPTWKETCSALTDVGIKKPSGKTIAVSDSPSRAKAPGYVPSRSDNAKVRKISERLKSLSEKLPEAGLGKNEIIYELSTALSIGNAESGQSNYVAVNANGVETTIRVSNHSANTSNFGITSNNVGIVIKTSNNRFRTDEGVDYVEFMYYGDKVDGNAERQRAIINGLRYYIETGSFEKMPQADRLNTSGAYRKAVDAIGEVFAEAEDMAMRRKTGWDKTMFADGGNKKNTAGSEEGLNPTYPASHSGQDMTGNEARLNDLDPASNHDAKVIEKLEIAKAGLSEVAELYRGETNPRGFLTDLGKSIGIIMGHSGSGYRTFELKDGRILKIRLSTHNANAENAKIGEPVVSIAIKPKRTPNTFVIDDNKVVDEYVYFKEDIRKAPAGTLSSIAESISELLDTGEYKDRTGLARENHSPGNDGVHFRDGGLGLEETITRMKAVAATANADNLQAKREAMRAIGVNLNHLRQAMARQREYDLTTVKSVTDLAKILLDNNMLDDLSKYEVKRILGAVDNAVGRKDVSGQVEKVMDIMVDNQLRMGANALGRLLSYKGSRTDARGVEVQGGLDAEGQSVVRVVRKSTSMKKEDIENLLSEAIDRMSNPDTAISEEAAIEYAGLQIALQYVENISESKNEVKLLRDSISQAKADKEAGQMTAKEYRQYVAATEDAIRQNKIERAEAYQVLVEQIGGVLSESVERAKAWREGEKRRVEDIHHNANSDMEGRPTDEHHKNSAVQKLANNSLLRFALAPLATFDQMLRMFGQKNVRGEGYLWNRYMRGWVEATEREYNGYRDSLRRLDDKVSGVFGKKMKWGDLFTIDRRLPKASVSFWDGGEKKEHELTQGNLLYIYMADKMADGRMKLRKMGISEEDVERIKNSLDPRFIELADWLQDEFLVEKRNEYNEVHKRMFGASMAAIENYFPLKILANARMEDVDVADDTTDTALPATSTGSIIKRKRNNLALDVTGGNAFSVVLDHLQQMERWAAFAEFNRDLNTLLSYKRFRNQVMNMSSVYGGGKTLWNNFRNVCSMAAGAYRPPVAPLDKSAVNIAKGVTAAKVSFRLFTALKQFLSMPAYLSDSNPLYLAKNILSPWTAWSWSMKNLPLFEKRWKSRMAGDPRLLKSEMDWKAWRSKVVQLASRVGMSPNAFVDAVTVAIGAHSMYETKKKKYLRWGMSEAEAEKRAKQDATILFNQTQQSSESAFLSTMQVDRSWLSVLFTVFRNSSMSYTRQQFDAIRNLARRLQSGYAGLSKEFMAKQMRRDGIDPDIADKESKREYRRGIIRDIARVAVFGYILQLAWNMGAYLPYLLLGDDDEEKDKMWDDVINHTYFGSLEGLTGGDVMSSAGQMWLNGDGNWGYLTKEMPLAGDLATIYRKMGRDNVAALNDVVNLLAQSSLGVNPQSLTDAVVAVLDCCGDDAQTQRECALVIARVLNCPQSQLDKIYFDELSASGDEASRMTPREIAERYARYKTRRNAPMTGWLYSEEERGAVMDKQRTKSNTLAKERLGRQTDGYAPDIKGWMEEYNATKKRLSEINKNREDDEDAYYERLSELEQTPEYERYEIVKSYKHDIDEVTKEWLRSDSPEQRDSLVRAIVSLKQSMVKELNTQQ